MALAIVADHRDRLAALAASGVECVAAAAADELELHILARAADVEAIISLESVDDDLLESGKADEQARAEHALVVHHEIVAELRADDGQRVEAVASLDAHRRIHRI